MQILSVNIGQARELNVGPKTVTTGLFKLPVDGPQELTPLGLAGDVICSSQHHGGPDQAVYVYTAPDYAWWGGTLGRDIAPGTFGENLTLSDLESAEMVIGDRLVLDEVTLEVTAPRIPCAAFAARMEDSGFVKRFRLAERPGFYCRVLRTGRVRAGERVHYLPATRPGVTIRDVYRDHYEPELTETAIQRFLDAPLAERARAAKLQQLHALRGQPAI